MTVPLTINGVTYDFPNQDDTDWGYAVTAWAEAVTVNLFPKTGGNFFLASDLNFGPAGGVIAKNFSTYVDPAQSGAIRLTDGEAIAWRIGGADSKLAASANGVQLRLRFNGSELVDADSTQTLSNKTLLNATFAGTVNIVISPNRVAVSDGAGHLTASSVTDVQLGYLSTTTSNVQTQINNRQPLNADLTAITNLSADGWLVRTGTNQWKSYSFTSGDGTVQILNTSTSATGQLDFRVNSVPFSKVTGVPTTLAGYGITDAVQNTGNTPSIGSGTSGLRPLAGTAGRLFIDSTSKTLQRDNGTSWDVIGSAYVAGSPSTPNVNPVATGDGSVAIGDSSTTLGVNALAVGRSSTASGTRSIALGFGSTAFYANSVAIGGNQTSTNYPGQIAFGNANDNAGVSVGGMSITTLVQKTTSSTVTEMDLDLATHGHIACQDNYTYLYDCDIVARDTTNLAAKNYASWNLKFTFIRGVGVGSVILSGVQKSLVGASGAAGWDVTVTADATNGRPAIKVTGAASTNVNWSAFLKTIRVSNN